MGIHTSPELLRRCSVMVGIFSDCVVDSQRLVDSHQPGNHDYAAYEGVGRRSFGEDSGEDPPGIPGICPSYQRILPNATKTSMKSEAAKA